MGFIYIPRHRSPSTGHLEGHRATRHVARWNCQAFKAALRGDPGTCLGPHKPAKAQRRLAWGRFPFLGYNCRISLGAGGAVRHPPLPRDLYWPLATNPCPFLEPFPSIGGGAHQPLNTVCPSFPCLPHPYLPTHPSFPLVGCANRAPGLSLFHCSVSGRQRGGPQPSPLARCIPADTPNVRWGNPPQQRLLGPRMSMCKVTSPTVVKISLLSLHSQSSPCGLQVPGPLPACRQTLFNACHKMSPFGSAVVRGSSACRARTGCGHSPPTRGGLRNGASRRRQTFAGAGTRRSPRRGTAAPSCAALCPCLPLPPPPVHLRRRGQPPGETACA